MRKKIVAANWKMNMTQAESARFVESFLRDVGDITDVEVVIIPPFTAIAKVREALGRAHNIKVGAQNMFWEKSGADFAGERAVALPMHVLRADLDVLRFAERFRHFRNRRERRHDDHFDIGNVAELKKQRLDKSRRLGLGHVHLPISGDDFLAHKICLAEESTKSISSKNSFRPFC